MLSLLFLSVFFQLGLALPTDTPSLKASFGSYSVCKSIATMCGLPPETGYTASISQNYFTVDNNVACGKCYEITAETDAKGIKLAKPPAPIVVMIDDACPESTTTCAPLLTDPAAKNSLGVSAHFDLCDDSGASQTWFGGNDTMENFVGTAKVVDCKAWKGTLYGDPAMATGEVSGQIVP